jgi:hypothetical protein
MLPNISDGCRIFFRVRIVDLALEGHKGVEEWQSIGQVAFTYIHFPKVPAHDYFAAPVINLVGNGYALFEVLNGLVRIP